MGAYVVARSVVSGEAVVSSTSPSELSVLFFSPFPSLSPFSPFDTVERALSSPTRTPITSHTLSNSSVAADKSFEKVSTSENDEGRGEKQRGVIKPSKPSLARYVRDDSVDG